MSGSDKRRTLIRGILSTLVALSILVAAAPVLADSPFFAKSYAIVVGINNYPHRSWPKLTYAVKDAQGFAGFLRMQGFEVITLYDKEATRQAIIGAVVDRLAPKLTEQDRVLFFFAGHGKTQTVGDGEYGHLVPYDADDSFASLVPMYQIRALSSVMSMAKHQLFILDACFGGLIAMRSSTVSRVIDPRTPKYIEEITKRRARQVLTAGGADQVVADVGPDGHSVFTGQLLKALQEGLADKNGDGFITFSELNSYIQVAASRWNQTPGAVDLPGHEQGEFVFVNSNRKPTSSSGQVSIGRFRSADGDIYELLKTGKQLFQQKNFIAALGKFLEAAEMGNAEAMTYLGAMYSHGYGIPRDQDKALGWYQAAAERGDVLAMKSLVVIYSPPGDDPPNPSWNPTEAARWRLAIAEADKLANAIVLLDPSGRADRGEPTIPQSAVIAAPPAAPTNLRVQ